MAITRVREATGTGSSTTPQVVFASAPSAGDLIVVMTSFAVVASGTTNSGWTDWTGASLFSTDVGAPYYKVAGAGESATQNPSTLVSSTSWTCVGRIYSGADQSAPLEVADLVASTTTSKASSAVDPANSVERLFVGVAFSDGARTYSAHSFTGGGTVNVAGSPSTGTTNSGESCTMWDIIQTSGAGTYAATVTCSAADGGGCGIGIFKAAAAATKAPPPFQRPWRRLQRKAIV